MATQPSDCTEFPAEIVLKPSPLIGLSGLDAVNNAIHRAVWDAFANHRRPDRTPLRFELLANTLDFPVVKPERTSYEWYVPRGVLKRNWIRKRVALVPAVVVVFYDMEWDDPQWNEKIIECASRVRSVRAALAGHASRMAVAVLQRAPAAPPSERADDAERAQALCAACELPAKALFVLPHGDRLPGYVLRLEGAFHDMAQTYYHHEIKAVKRHRDRLDRTTHRYLIVRHQFKLGFLNEMRRDPSAAHKHYLHAYNELADTRPPDADAHEIRTVAGYINYKLCRLLFALNLPRDAISQLKSHIERYESRTGPAELLFEHHAWLARQYAAFGELFDEAIRAGLPAVRSQHPGFYYRHAAQHTVRRRQAARAACGEAEEYPLPDPLEGASDFYGQRAWRPARLGADPPDPARERAAVRALQYNERRFDHSTVIVGFLGAAISQFKTFHSPRARRRLVVEMADEYYQSADYGKALTLLVHMLWDYRRERWWGLSSHVLTRALRCAYLAAEVRDYVRLAVEALSDRVRVRLDDRDRMFTNLMRVLDGEAPGPEPDVPEAADAWRAALLREPVDVAVDMTDISSFIEIKPKFRQQKYRVDENVIVELYIRLSYRTTLRVKRATVTVSGGGGTTELAAGDGDELVLRGGADVLQARYEPGPRDGGSRVRIEAVTLLLDNDKNNKIYLNFKMNDARPTDSAPLPELLHFIPSPRVDHEFDGVVPQTVAQITPRECKLAVSFVNVGPALQGERFPTELVITNREDDRVRDLTVTLSLQPSPDNPDPHAATALTAPDSGTASDLRPPPAPITAPAPAVFVHDELRRSQTLSDTFYIKCGRTTTVTVQARVSYLMDVPEAAGVECVRDFVTKIAVVKPFEVSADFVDVNFRPITKCFVDDPFIIMPRIKILSPRPLLIEHTELEVADCYALADEAAPSAVAGLHADDGAVVADAVCVRATRVPRDRPARVGLYTVRWRRPDGGSSVTSSVPLPAPALAECPVAVVARFPATVELRAPLELRCEVRARSARPLHLSVTAEGTDSYMFAGYKTVSLTVPPREAAVLRYRLYPLVAGRTRPPRLAVSVLHDAGAQAGVQDVFHKVLPGHIFVMPKYNK